MTKLKTCIRKKRKGKLCLLYTVSCPDWTGTTHLSLLPDKPEPPRPFFDLVLTWQEGGHWREGVGGSGVWRGDWGLGTLVEEFHHQAKLSLPLQIVISSLWGGAFVIVSKSNFVHSSFLQLKSFISPWPQWIVLFSNPIRKQRRQKSKSSLCLWPHLTWDKLVLLWEKYCGNEIEWSIQRNIVAIKPNCVPASSL